MPDAGVGEAVDGNLDLPVQDFIHGVLQKDSSIPGTESPPAEMDQSGGRSGPRDSPEDRSDHDVGTDQPPQEEPMDISIRLKPLLDDSPRGDETDQLEDASTMEDHDEGLEELGEF